jgi:hypothetical protein
MMSGGGQGGSLCHSSTSALAGCWGEAAGERPSRTNTHGRVSGLAVSERVISHDSSKRGSLCNSSLLARRRHRNRNRSTAIHPANQPAVQSGPAYVPWVISNEKRAVSTTS